MELQPESDNQPAIRPTQFIMHSVAAPWDEERIYEYWRDSTNLESHFGLDYDGSIAQFIGTQTRADANYRANLRPDGTGAVSIETASDDDASDPWTPEQIEQLILLGVWLHQEHGIPLRVCRDASDPGYGYHRLHADWAVSGTDCPGDQRVEQFNDVVFPGIVRRAGGTPSSPPPAAPSVSLSRLIAAAKSDPPKSGTPVSYSGVQAVEQALVAEGLLSPSLADGHFGTATVTAYAKWQRRQGYSGTDADGIPGRASLVVLAARHAFTVTS
ncbi:N-acetylmuramoyl-L-alanine amidase [Streptomyces sp. NPDC059104]|uniref:N-acetylmuramoyl-L-alanine amidase n=1 Tax=Streptomyces sp. NPDC059104 TaxID=3346729 RepID=UPI00367DCED3